METLDAACVLLSEIYSRTFTIRHLSEWDLYFIGTWSLSIRKRASSGGSSIGESQRFSSITTTIRQISNKNSSLVPILYFAPFDDLSNRRDIRCAKFKPLDKMKQRFDPLLVGFLVFFSIFALIFVTSALSTSKRLTYEQRKDSRKYVGLALLFLISEIVIVIVEWWTTCERFAASYFCGILLFLLLITVVILLRFDSAIASRVSISENTLLVQMLSVVSALSILTVLLCLAFFLYCLDGKQIQ